MHQFPIWNSVRGFRFKFGGKLRQLTPTHTPTPKPPLGGFGCGGMGGLLSLPNRPKDDSGGLTNKPP